LLKSSIQKINNSAYFIIDLPSYLGTIIGYDHTLATQTICSMGNINLEIRTEEVSQEELPKIGAPLPESQCDSSSKPEEAA